MLKIQHLIMNNINGISELELSFKPGLNLICGPNGVGKTTILDCIYGTFRKNKSNISRTVGMPYYYQSNYEVFMETLYGFETRNIVLEEHTNKMNRERVKGMEVVYLNVSDRIVANRTSYYDRNKNGAGRTPLDTIKNWLYRNYFDVEQMSIFKYNNINSTKELFSALEETTSFSRMELIDIEPKSEIQPYFWPIPTETKQKLNLFIQTPQGEVPIEYMSSGYKSSVIILLEIVRNVERLTQSTVDYFDGLILIDELDLHLHPEWQAKIVNVLKWLLPHAQIIATTHSPHMIQAADPGEIIPLGMSYDREVYVRRLPSSSEFGYQGWTIEEILTHVMGLTNPMSRVFQENIKKFQRGVLDEDPKIVTETYKALRSMLHQDNPLITLLSIQAGELVCWEELE